MQNPEDGWRKWMSKKCHAQEYLIDNEGFNTQLQIDACEIAY